MLIFIIVTVIANKVYVCFFRVQDDFSVLVVKEESIPIFKQNVTMISIGVRGKQ